jgi:uncharacterized cupredoxin-like copper-binding protein
MRLFTRVAMTAALAALALILTGCGSDKPTSTASDSTRTIEVTMTDNAYQPTQLQVAPGETVTLRFENTGTVAHEAILGDDAAQMEHHAEMTAATAAMDHDGMDHSPAESSTDEVTVEPGKSGELTHTFTESGMILIGCHEPGHWEDGMKSTITIG